MVPLSLTVVRVVQEALTNVGRHAGRVETTVAVESEAGVLIVEVVNASGSGRDGVGSGRGVAGMRERVALYGGSLSVGPTPEGGWRVRAELPVDRR